MKGTLGLKKGSVPFKIDLETTLRMYIRKMVGWRPTMYIRMCVCIT